jgi:ATP-dependent Lon protease
MTKGMKTWPESMDRNPFDAPWALEDECESRPDLPSRGPTTEEKTENPPRWRVFKPEDARGLLPEAGAQTEFGKGQIRLGWLETMADDPDCGLRPLIIPEKRQIDAVGTLHATAPHLARFFDVVIPSLRAARQTGLPLALPPILLLGPPGVGKTYIAREMAKAIGMPALSISMPNQSTTNVFAGRDMSWKSPAIGMVARTLITEKSASPLFILDEIDKTAGRDTEYGDQLGPLHDLLETSTAQAFEDELLKLRFDASRACWLATANDLASLPPSLLDRFLIIEVPAPGEQQMIVVLESLYGDLVSAWDGWFSPCLPPGVVKALRQTHPRKARQTLSLALTLAASSNRHILNIEDITWARQILDQGAQKPRIGFV